jgi:hypothetical protein
MIDLLSFCIDRGILVSSDISWNTVNTVVISLDGLVLVFW